jgi:hypothetical protein
MKIVKTYFIYTHNNWEENVNVKLPEALHYLNSQHTSPDKSAEWLFKDDIAFNAYLFAGKTIANENQYIDMEVFDTTGFDKLVANSLLHFATARENLNFTVQTTDFKTAEHASELDDRKLIIFKMTLFIINQLTTYSASFGINEPHTDPTGLNAHLLFLNDDHFITKNIDTNIVLWNKTLSLLDYLVMNIASISKFCVENKQTWVELNAVETLLKIAQIKPSARFDAYSSIVNVASDEQIENFEAIQSFKQMLLERLKRFEQEFLSGEVRRAQRQIYENNSRIRCEVITIYEENRTVISLFTVVKGLYKLAINDQMRKDIYFLKYPLNVLYNTKDHLKTFLFKGNAHEVKYTLR